MLRRGLSVNLGFGGLNIVEKRVSFLAVKRQPQFPIELLCDMVSNSFRAVHPKCDLKDLRDRLGSVGKFIAGVRCISVLGQCIGP
jgi:hypothetical protein